jgi:transcriptional regulator with XRE-family HTH domain
MTLTAYLKATNQTAAAFARKVGISRMQVHRYVYGQMPGPDVMTKIRKATRGKVQPNDFYGSAK